MSKNLNVTSSILEKVRAATEDEGLEASSIVVFETQLVSTRPLNKRGSIFDKGRISRSMLTDMQAHIEAGNANPLHTLHQQGRELPVGRVFSTELFDTADGETILQGLFYLSIDKTDLIADINSSTLDEVSVGVLSKSLLCSECGWDYQGDDASFLNLWDRTCGNDHTVGEKGVHVRLVGLDQWMETSLVSKGAAADSKIVSRAKSQLGEGQMERLAASGLAPEALILNATIQTEDIVSENTGNTGDNSGVVLELTNTIANGRVDLAQKDNEIVTLTAQLEKVTAELTTANETLEASSNSDVVADLQTQLDAANANLTSVGEFMTEQTRSALVASGQTDPEVPESIADQMAAITEIGAKFHALVGGTSTDASGGTGEVQKRTSVNAFKTRK